MKAIQLIDSDTQSETFAHERDAYEKHCAQIRREFWALVRNRPTRFLRFWRQRRQILCQLREDFNAGKYL